MARYFERRINKEKDEKGNGFLIATCEGKEKAGKNGTKPKRKKKNGASFHTSSKKNRRVKFQTRLVYYIVVEYVGGLYLFVDTRKGASF